MVSLPLIISTGFKSNGLVVVVRALKKMQGLDVLALIRWGVIKTGLLKAERCLVQ